MKVRLLPIIIAVFCSSPLIAEERSILFLDEVLEIAAKKSELLKADEENIKSKESYLKQSTSNMNPNVEFGSGLKKSAEERGVSYSFGLTQPLYFPGKRSLRAAIMEQDVEVAKIGLQQTRLFVYYETMRLSAAYFIAKKKTEHIKERLDVFSQLQEYMKTRPFASPQKRVEKYIIGNKIDLLSKELRRVQTEHDILWSELNAYLSLPEKKEILFSFPEKPIDVNLEEIISKSEKHNTVIVGLLTNMKKKSYERDLASLDKYSDFAFSVVYSGDNLRGKEKNIGGSVTFMVPLFNRSTDAISALDAEIRSENNKLLFERRSLREKVKAAYAEFVVAEQTRKNLPLSLLTSLHAQKEEADDAFRKGLLDFVTYLEMESNIYEKHQAIFSSQYEYVDKVASLFLLSGETRNFFGKERMK